MEYFYTTGVSINKINHFIKSIFNPDTEEINYYYNGCKKWSTSNLHYMRSYYQLGDDIIDDTSFHYH